MAMRRYTLSCRDGAMMKTRVKFRSRNCTIYGVIAGDLRELQILARVRGVKKAIVYLDDGRISIRALKSLRVVDQLGLSLATKSD